MYVNLNETKFRKSGPCSVETTTRIATASATRIAAPATAGKATASGATTTRTGCPGAQWFFAAKTAATPTAGTMAASGFGRALFGFLYGNNISFKKYTINIVNSIVGLELIGHFHKTKTARHTGGVIIDYLGGNNLAIFFKQGTQF